MAIIVPAMDAKRADEDDAAFYARVFDQAMAANPALIGRPFVDVHDEDVTKFSRKDRHRLRLTDGVVVVDQTIPRRPKDVREALRGEVAAASTVADLKRVLGRLLE